MVPLEELKKGVQVQEKSWSKDFYAQAPQVGLLHFLALLVSVSAPQALCCSEVPLMGAEAARRVGEENGRSFKSFCVGMKETATTELKNN